MDEDIVAPGSERHILPDKQNNRLGETGLVPVQMDVQIAIVQVLFAYLQPLLVARRVVQCNIDIAVVILTD